MLDRVGRSRDNGAKARHEAFADLHREHASGIYNLALRLVGDREDARDISQDVLLKAFERLGRDGELHQRAWLYRVTVNACYDHRRALRRRPRADTEVDTELACSVDGYEQAQLLRCVEFALRGIPPAQRAALLLREVHGLPTAEVAFALGIQADSAAVTLSRARVSFRRRFLEVYSHNGDRAVKAASGRRGGLASVLNGAGAAAFGIGLPGVWLPNAPLPAGLDVASLISAASTLAGGAAVGVGGGAVVGVLGKIAAALSTKAAVVGAGATLVTGSIGGVYAVERSHQTAVPPPIVAPVAQTQAAAPGPVTDLPAQPAPQPSSRPAGNPSASTSPLPLPSSSPASPLPSPSPTTFGESDETPTPSPSPSESPGSPSPTPDPTPTNGPGSPSPAPSPSPATPPSGPPSPSPTASPEPSPSPTASPEPAPSPSPSL